MNKTRLELLRYFKEILLIVNDWSQEILLGRSKFNIFFALVDMTTQDVERGKDKTRITL